MFRGKGQQPRAFNDVDTPLSLRLIGVQQYDLVATQQLTALCQVQLWCLAVQECEKVACAVVVVEAEQDLVTAAIDRLRPRLCLLYTSPSPRDS